MGVMTTVEITPPAIDWVGLTTRLAQNCTLSEMSAPEQRFSQFRSILVTHLNGMTS